MTEEFKKACVIGWPIAHSLSPYMHTEWLKTYGIKGSYSAMAVPAPKLQDALQTLIDDGYAGCNLTAPHKEAALALMDEHDQSAIEAGAVNTVVVKNGRLKGYDSDGFGFVENLNARFPQWQGDRIVIIGTGGASRSIIAALKGAGAKHFVLVNRTQERAEKICQTLCVHSEVLPWDARAEALKDATMVINSTSLGMADQGPLDLDLQHLPQTALVADIVYRPLMTPLLANALARGNPVLKGLGMLMHQGRLGFKLWFGKDPEVTGDLYDRMKDLAREKVAA